MQVSKEGVGTANIETPSALVLCDSKLYRIALYRNNAAVDYALANLHLANLIAVGSKLFRK